MHRDPAKKITGFATGRHGEKFCVVLILDDRGLIVAESETVDRAQAEVLGNGYLDGVETGDGIPADVLIDLLSDPQALAELEYPAEMTSVTRDLMKRGAVAGLRLAAAGYWVSPELAVQGQTVH